MRFSLAFLLAVFPLDAQELRFREYGRNDGFPGGHVDAMRQDQAGWLWVAGARGLYRFDGHTFERWGSATGLPAGAVHAVEETTDGRLWAITPQGIAVRHPGRAKFERVDVPVSEHQRLTAAAAGPQLFVADQSTLWMLRFPAPAAPVQVRSINAPPGATPLRSVTVDGQGTAWVICGSHLCQLNTGANQLSLVDLGLPRTTWLRLAAGPHGELALRAADALWIRESGATLFRASGDSVGGTTLEGAALAFTAEGELLASTVSGFSVGRLRDGLRYWQSIGSNNGLRSPFVTTIALDREGAAWLGQGSEPSVVRWDRRAQWEHWGRGRGLDDQAAWGLARDAGGTLWAASHSGLYQKTRERFTAMPSAPNEYYTHPAAAPDGSLWVLVNRDRVRRIAGTTTQDFPLPNSRLRFLLLDQQRRLWVIGDQLYRTAGDITQGPAQFLPARPPGIGAGEQFSQAALDSRGRVFITGTDGLVVYDPASGRWERLGVNAGLASLRLQAVLADSSGRVWVSYRQPAAPGRLHFVNGHWQADHLSVPPALARATVVSFAEDREKRIWVGTESGIFVWNGTAWRHYGLDDGLSSDDCTAGGLFADPDGSLWASTGRGLSRFADDRPALAPLPLPRGAIVDLDQQGRAVEFSLRSLSFWRPDDQLFLYRLNGRRFFGNVFDSGWVEARDPDIRHENLPGGSYAVELKTRNADGVWSTANIRQEFRVPIPWYASTWFLATAVTGVPLAFYWWRRRQRVLRAHRESWDRERLTREVSLRTKTLDEARLQAEEANRRKSELLAGMGEQIRRPLHGLNGLVELALSSAKDEKQRQYLASAQESAASLLAMVGDVLDYAETESGHVALRQEPCDLRDCVRGVVLTLQNSARAGGQPVSGEVSADVPALVIGDRQRLRQVLLHIASHVLRQGGVSLAVEIEYASAEAVVLVFGFYDPAARPGPFSSLDPHEVAGRDGLELAIAARMIDLMGGRLTACGSTGHRSFRFSIRLPVADQHGAGTLRVLLAEDDIQNRRITAALLEQVGFAVTTLGSSHDALEHASGYDVLLLDAEMPEALPIVSQIRAAARAASRPPLRIVGLTTHDSSRQLAEADGFDTVLLKPVRFEDLLLAIRANAAAPQAGS